ncbi:class I SAM-dependent methyltransferase [Nocardia harenae]|uniref:class I SAM-dependent methyltransferase n=1 Tax=Nocardia harenae TaxID=358707 RepID=UPI00082E3EE4|nr:class I SAM-dependent methyltransferase [Nocardia harenae]
MAEARYDRTGRTYTATRRPDPRIAARLHAALGSARSVLNVGAGTGSYEPPGTVLAVEPSAVMIAQRPPGAAPAVRGVAEALPLPDDSVDAALAVLTLHHWTDVAAGLAELRRVARERVVVVTWDHAVTADFWLLRDYLPGAAATDAALAVPIAEVAARLGAAVHPVPVPWDCADGFACAFWRRPEAYLDPLVRAGASMFSLTPEPELRTGLDRLAADLADGSWHRRHAALLDRTELDLGYRLLIAELRAG